MRHLPLHLGDRRRRRLDVHQRKVRLAVLLDAEGEDLQAPIFGLADRAAGARDHALELLDQLVDLCTRYVLTGQEHMLVECHDVLAFPRFVASRASGAEPLASLVERLERPVSRKSGDTGRRENTPAMRR